MMSMSVIAPKLQTALQKAVKNQVSRPMTIMSKQSGEEYKKKVSKCEDRSCSNHRHRYSWCVMRPFVHLLHFFFIVANCISASPFFH
jgi:hypothetical protein